MPVSTLLGSEAGTNLKDITGASRQEAFHALFRRTLQKPAARRDWFDIALRQQHRLPDRSVDFNKPLLAKKTTDQMKKFSPELKCFPIQHTYSFTLVT